MKKIVNILNFIFIALVLVGDVCYMLYGGLWLKGITSAGFALIGIINFIYAFLAKEDLKFPIIMLFGLVFGMAGDIVLNVHFIGGAILFALGHVLYFVAFCALSKFDWKDLIYGGVIAIISVLIVTLIPAFEYGSVMMEIVCAFYAAIISLMVGKALSNLVKVQNLTNTLIFIGSCLFFISDLMLLLDCFSSASNIVGAICLATYYPAQCILAYSIFKNSK